MLQQKEPKTFIEFIGAPFSMGFGFLLTLLCSRGSFSIYLHTIYPHGKLPKLH